MDTLAEFDLKIEGLNQVQLAELEAALELQPVSDDRMWIGHTLTAVIMLGGSLVDSNTGAPLTYAAIYAGSSDAELKNEIDWHFTCMRSNLADGYASTNVRSDDPMADPN